MHIHLTERALYKMWKKRGIRAITVLIALFYSVAIAVIPLFLVLCLAGEGFEKADTPAGDYGKAVVAPGGANVKGR